MVRIQPWILGYPEQAYERVDRATELAHTVEHPFNSAYVLTIAAVIDSVSRSYGIFDQRRKQATALTVEHGFSFWDALLQVLRGSGQAHEEFPQEGIAEILEGIAAYKRTGAGVSLAHFHALLAEAHMIAEQAEDGLRTVVEALAHVAETGEKYWEAEIYRLQGELLLLRATSDGEAEQSFIHALDVARQQSAKSWELRTAMSLARLWQKQGKHTEARELLTGVYSWFTEGFDTQDLNDAKALLEELG